MLILMAGLPGTGKSTAARELAAKLNAVVLSKDIVRHALFPPELIEYSTNQDDFVIGILLQTAAYFWQCDALKIVVLDGRTFSRASQRKHVIAFAESRQQPWRIIECVCHDEIARARLAQPDAAHPAANRTPELFEEVKRRWEPITEPKISIDSSSKINIEHLVQQLFP